MKTIITILSVLFSTALIAVEVKPYEIAEITEEQWNQYHSASFAPHSLVVVEIHRASPVLVSSPAV